MHRWTQEEVSFVRANYSVHGSDWCAVRLGLTAGQVRSMASSKLGLKLSPEAMAKSYATRKQNIDPDWDIDPDELARRCAEVRAERETQIQRRAWRCPVCRIRVA